MQSAHGFRRIELIGASGNAVASNSCGGASPYDAPFARNVTAKTFLVAQAIQSDGGRLVSAPF